ncbi:MAG TPA: chorismate mutase [Gaiellaceae bacterium]|nr:chorismate mutase [Gaiellaceae bacterium]
MEDDPVVRDAREQITAVDRAIFEAVNRRIELVRELRSYKETKGYDFVDPGREQRMIDERLVENDGPLSTEGLRSLYAELLALTKREVS